MPYFTYIIQSESIGKLYIGQTSNIRERLFRHNSNQSLSTRNKGPWKLIFCREFESRTDAIKLESTLKSFKNRNRILRWIEIQTV
ncbi:MAG TPA: GIY-YIG nuclease family protein [Ignavibacteria bacterium]|nr:GIY-YIG nuclease family protein [Ignavibacteria bacterium]